MKELAFRDIFPKSIVFSYLYSFASSQPPARQQSTVIYGRTSIDVFSDVTH